MSMNPVVAFTFSFTQFLTLENEPGTFSLFPPAETFCTEWRMWKIEEIIPVIVIKLLLGSGESWEIVISFFFSVFLQERW